MKSNTRIVKFVAVAALVAGSVSAASAAGLLGQRYAGATFDWSILDDNQWTITDGEETVRVKVDDGHGTTLVLNQPLTSNVDLKLSYSFVDSEIRATSGEDEVTADLNAQSLNFGAVYHTEVGGVKPFAGLTLGWLRSKAAGETQNDLLYTLAAGAELPAGAKASLTPFVSWSDNDSHDIDNNGLWAVGAVADFDVTSSWSIVTKGELAEHSDWGASVGVLFRF